MFCKNCGNIMNDDEKFCKSCGAPAPQPQQNNYGYQQNSYQQPQQGYGQNYAQPGSRQNYNGQRRPNQNGQYRPPRNY